MAVLLDALRRLAPAGPGLRLLVVGRGDAGRPAPRLPARSSPTGSTSSAGSTTATRRRLLRSVDVYCAPNTGGESFGMVLTEAMAAGAAVLASDLGAFRPRCVDGRATPDGRRAVPDRRRPRARRRAGRAARRPGSGGPRSARAGRARAAAFDWPVVAADVLRVYRAAIAADPRRVPGRTAASTR